MQVRSIISDCEALLGNAGGIYLSHETRGRIVNSTISHSRAYLSAGCVWLLGDVEIENTEISHCRAETSADQPDLRTAGCGLIGGVLNMTSSNVTDCFAQGNGGALLLSTGSAATLTSVRITDSQTQASGGGLYVDVGASITMTASNISNCTSWSNGGAICFFGSTLALVDSTVATCSAQSGGGFFAPSSNVHMSATFTNTLVTGCSASTRGGGIAASAGSVLLQAKTLILGNVAPIAPSISAEGAIVTYALPAPRGRW